MKIARAIVPMLLGSGIALAAQAADAIDVAHRGGAALRFDAAALLSDMLPAGSPPPRTEFAPRTMLDRALPSVAARDMAFDGSLRLVGAERTDGTPSADLPGLLERLRLAPAASGGPAGGGTLQWLSALAIAGLVARRRLL